MAGVLVGLTSEEPAEQVEPDTVNQTEGIADLCHMKFADIEAGMFCLLSYVPYRQEIAAISKDTLGKVKRTHDMPEKIRKVQLAGNWIDSIDCLTSQMIQSIAKGERYGASWTVDEA